MKQSRATGKLRLIRCPALFISILGSFGCPEDSSASHYDCHLAAIRLRAVDILHQLYALRGVSCSPGNGRLIEFLAYKD